MTRECANSGCTFHTDSGICKQCSVEQNWGDPADYNPDGTRADAKGDFEKAELRDGETRDDDNTHDLRNEQQKRIADRELGDDEPEIRTDGGTSETVQRTLFDDEFDSEPERPSWLPGDVETQQNRCRNCGNPVTEQYARVFGDNENDILWHCPECDGIYNRDMKQGAGARPDYDPDEDRGTTSDNHDLFGSDGGDES